MLSYQRGHIQVSAGFGVIRECWTCTWLIAREIHIIFTFERAWLSSLQPLYNLSIKLSLSIAASEGNSKSNFRAKIFADLRKKSVLLFNALQCRVGGFEQQRFRLSRNTQLLWPIKCFLKWHIQLQRWLVTRRLWVLFSRKENHYFRWEMRACTWLPLLGVTISYFNERMWLLPNFKSKAFISPNFLTELKKLFVWFKFPLLKKAQKFLSRLKDIS